MSERSDLSGEPIDDGRQAEISVKLAGGRRRLLRVSAAEQERLGGLGTEIPGPGAKGLMLMRRYGWKAVRWLAAAVAVAVIGQSVARHYANRRQALDLKASLVTTISRAAVRDYEAAFDVVNIGVAHHQRGLRAIRRRNRVIAAWSATEGEVDPLVFIHFRDSAVQRDWSAYEFVLFNFFALSYVDHGDQRARSTQSIHTYLNNHPLSTPLPPPTQRDPWSVLACSALHCSDSVAWRAAYSWLGLTLLRERELLVRAILATDARNLG